jgi:acyl-CoA thioester hydrolase
MSKHLEHEIELAPAFYDVDPMNVVWHGHYVKFMELARAALLGKLNFSYRDMQECGYVFPVIELFVRYAQPLVLGQKVRVMAKIVEWESRLKVTYEIRDAATNRRLTRAHTVQVAVDARTQQMCYVCPQVMWDRLGVSGA